MERIKFKDNYQKIFISKVCERLNFSLKQLSSHININYYTLKGYFQEKHLMPRDLVRQLSYLGEIKEKDLPIDKILPHNWGASKGGKKGMEVLSTKYKGELIIWRKRGAKAGAKAIAGINKKEIKKPIINEKLAEFIGAYLGDGTLTNYFVRISGDPKYDLHYFEYLRDLIEEIFGIKSKISITKRNLLMLTISSIEMCNFLHKDLGLPYGNKIKNNSKIPSQFLINSPLIYSCLRGLIDTDGFVGKSNTRLKVVLTSHNKSLLEQIYSLSHNLFNKSYKTNLEISSKSKVMTYLEEIGSSNLRHIIRINEYIKNNHLLYKEEVSAYYEKYAEVKLPYYGSVV